MKRKPICSNPCTGKNTLLATYSESFLVITLNSGSLRADQTRAIPNISGAYYSAERNGTEHLIPQNTYFAERIEMGPKQLPRLAVII